MTTHVFSRSFAARQQRGVVLVVALLFLVLITIVAITASATSLLQQKLVGGQRNAQLAEWSAETALRGAEWRLWRASSNITTRMQCGSGTLSNCYVYAPDPTAAVAKFRTATGWVTDGATAFDDVDYTMVSADNTFKLAHNPYYLIEDLGPELPPGAGVQHESGATGSTGTGYTSTTNRHVYRITARGAGNNENAIRVLETTFAAKAD